MILRTCLLISSLVLAACGANTDNVVKTFELRQPAGAPYARILVVGAHPDPGIRRQFEETMVETLRAEQIDAVSSISMMDQDSRLAEDTVVDAAENARADVVLVSRLRDVRWSAVQDEGRSTTEARRRREGGLLDFFRNDYDEYEDPFKVSAVRTVIVATDLYRVVDHVRIWSIESTGLAKENAMEALENIATSTRSQLRRDGLVQ